MAQNRRREGAFVRAAPHLLHSALQAGVSAGGVAFVCLRQISRTARRRRPGAEWAVAAGDWERHADRQHIWRAAAHAAPADAGLERPLVRQHERRQGRGAFRLLTRSRAPRSAAATNTNISGCTVTEY